MSCWFLCAALLWLTRDLHFIPGWVAIFPKGITDTVAAVFVLFSMLAWPKKNIFKGELYEPMLAWTEVEKMFPWNVVCTKSYSC